MSSKSILQSSITVENVTQRDFGTDIIFTSDIEVKYYAFTNFPPFDGIPDFLLKEDLQRSRRIVLDFRNGISSKKVAQILSNFITANFSDLNKIIFCVIPASGKNKTERRFRSFCNDVCSITGMKNGYDLISFSETGSTEESDLKSIEIKDSIHFTDIFVFDDAIQSGKTFSRVCKELYLQGAKSVTGFFLGDALTSGNVE